MEQAFHLQVLYRYFGFAGTFIVWAIDGLIRNIHFSEQLIQLLPVALQRMIESFTFFRDTEFLNKRRITGFLLTEAGCMPYHSTQNTLPAITYYY